MKIDVNRPTKPIKAFEFGDVLQVVEGSGKSDEYHVVVSAQENYFITCIFKKDGSYWCSDTHYTADCFICVGKVKNPIIEVEWF